MSFIKKKIAEVWDDRDPLICTASGCKNLWSVRLEGSGPKCSFHAWKKSEPRSINIADRLRTAHVKPYVETD